MRKLARIIVLFTILFGLLTPLSNAFWLFFHDDITREGLDDYFETKSLFALGKNNSATDIKEPDDTAAHFDSESFTSGNQRIQYLVMSAIVDADNGLSHKGFQFIRNRK